MKEKESKKTRRLWRRILAAVIVGLLAVTFLQVFVSRLKGKEPSVFGLRFNVVQTGSMSPELIPGDLIISRAYRGQELNVGDIVTYVSQTGQMKGRLITHRVVELEGDKLITRGDANSENDEPIDKSVVSSVMIYNTVVLKHIYSAVMSKVGFVILIVIPILVLIASEVVTIVKEVKKKGGDDT